MMNTKLIANKEYLDNMQWPPSISIDITGKCNLRCKHCFAYDHPQIDLDFEKIKYVVDNMKHLRSIELGLAEPTMHPDFEKIVNYITDKGIKIGMATNGILLKKIKKDVLAKFSWLFISITNDIDNGRIPDYRWLPCRYSLIYIFTNNNIDREIIVGRLQETNITNDVALQVRIDMNITDDRIAISNYLSLFHIYSNKYDGNIIFTPIDRYMSYKGECYYSHLKPLLMNDGYWYPCCVETEGKDYARRYRICAWNELDKLINAKVLVDCKHCSKVNSLQTIAKYMEHLDEEFMI